MAMSSEEKEVRKITKLLRNAKNNGVKIVLFEDTLSFYNLEEWENHFEKYGFEDSSHDDELEEIDSFSIQKN